MRQASGELPRCPRPHLTHTILCSILPCFPLSMDKNNMLLLMANPYSLCGTHWKNDYKSFQELLGVLLANV